MRLSATFEANPDIITEWKWLLRAVGFGTFPSSADEFVQQFLDLLRIKVQRPTLRVLKSKDNK
jgi:hypothetical protein